MLLKIKGIIVAFVMMCLFSACGMMDGGMGFYLTNPTDKSIEVEIDKQKYTLASNEIVKLELEAGVHTMILPDNESVDFKVFDNSSGGIINPTKSVHAIFTMIYVVDDKAASSFMPPTNEVLIDGVEYEGPIRTTDAMFIDNNMYHCTYAVGEPFPTTLTTGDSKSKGNMKSKYFTKKEFTDFYSKETTGNEEEHEKNKVAGGETQITEKQSTVFPVVDFDNKELQEQATKMLATVKAYMKAYAGEQEKYQKQYHEETMALINIKRDNMNVAENEKYNNFVNQAGSLMGIGITRL